MSEDRPQYVKPTEGEYRVGISFNPSGDPNVAHIKESVAELIDSIMEKGKDGRCTAIACTELESAARWAVASVTKDPKPSTADPLDDAVVAYKNRMDK